MRESAHIDELGRGTARWRPKCGAAEWLDLACEYSNIDPEMLAGRGRNLEVVRIRELIGRVGVERFGVKVTELADVLWKSRDGVSLWLRRGVTRRATDPEFASAASQIEFLAYEDS